MRGGVAASFVSEGKVALKRHWQLLIYLVLLMAGFNFMVSTVYRYELNDSSRVILIFSSSPTAPRICTPPC